MTNDEYDAITRELRIYLSKRCPIDEIEDIIHNILMKWWQKKAPK